MYQSTVNPNFSIPDMVKYHCNSCEADFILSEGRDNTKAVCPYCQGRNIEARVALEDPDTLGNLGCFAISFCKGVSSQ